MSNIKTNKYQFNGATKKSEISSGYFYICVMILDSIDIPYPFVYNFAEISYISPRMAGTNFQTGVEIGSL